MCVCVGVCVCMYVCIYVCKSCLLSFNLNEIEVWMDGMGWDGMILEGGPVPVVGYLWDIWDFGMGVR